MSEGNDSVTLPLSVSHLQGRTDVLHVWISAAGVHCTGRGMCSDLNLAVLLPLVC